MVLDGWMDGWRDRWRDSINKLSISPCGCTRPNPLVFYLAANEISELCRAAKIGTTSSSPSSSSAWSVLVVLVVGLRVDGLLKRGTRVRWFVMGTTSEIGLISQNTYKYGWTATMCDVISQRRWWTWLGWLVGWCNELLCRSKDVEANIILWDFFNAMPTPKVSLLCVNSYSNHWLKSW